MPLSPTVGKMKRVSRGVNGRVLRMVAKIIDEVERGAGEVLLIRALAFIYFFATSPTMGIPLYPSNSHRRNVLLYQMVLR